MFVHKNKNIDIFLPRFRVYAVNSVDPNAEQVIDDAEKAVGHNEAPDYKKAMEGAAATTLEGMRDRSGSIRNRLNEHRLTSKGVVEKAVDEQAKAQLADKAASEKYFDEKLNVLDSGFAESVRKLMGRSATEYALITERLNVLNSRIAEAQDQIAQAQELSKLYGEARQYMRRGRLGMPKHPLKGPAADPVNHKANKKLLQDLQDIQRETQTKKREYEARIKERFRGEIALQGTFQNLMLKYDPSLTSQMRDMLTQNAAGNSAALERAIKNLVASHRVTPKEATALRAMAEELRNKKAVAAKTFEIAGRESTTYEKPELVKSALGSVEKGKVIKVADDSEFRGASEEFTVRDVVVKDGKRIVLAEGQWGRIAFNTTDGQYTYRKSPTMVAGGTVSLFNKSKTKDLKDLKSITIYK